MATIKELKSNIDELEDSLLDKNISKTHKELFKSSLKKYKAELASKEDKVKKASSAKESKSASIKSKLKSKKLNARKKAKKRLTIAQKVKAFNKGRSKSNIQRDRERSALKPGKRVSQSGNTYFESRSSRADVSKRQKL